MEDGLSAFAHALLPNREISHLLYSFDVSNPVVARGVFSFIIAVRTFVEVIYV
jgi:hypothetical protein